MVDSLMNHIRHAPSVHVGDYEFFRYDFGEEGVRIRRSMLRDIRDGLVELASEFSPDYIMCMEPGGVQWGPMVAAELGLELRIVRARQEELNTPGKI